MLFRSKEALFSALQFELEGRRVLDLFAGCGQLGLSLIHIYSILLGLAGLLQAVLLLVLGFMALAHKDFNLPLVGDFADKHLGLPRRVKAVPQQPQAAYPQGQAYPYAGNQPPYGQQGYPAQQAPAYPQQPYAAPQAQQPASVGAQPVQQPQQPPYAGGQDSQTPPSR